MATTANVQTAAEQLETLRRKKTRLGKAIESGRAELNRLMGMELEASEILARVRISAKLEDDPAAAKQAVEAARDLLRKAVEKTTQAKEDLQDTERAALGLDPMIGVLEAQVAGAERAKLLEKLTARAPANAEKIIKGLAELGLLLRVRAGGPVALEGRQLIEGGIGEAAHPLVLERLANDLRQLLLADKEP